MKTSFSAISYFSTICVVLAKKVIFYHFSIVISYFWHVSIVKFVFSFPKTHSTQLVVVDTISVISTKLDICLKPCCEDTVLLYNILACS